MRVSKKLRSYKAGKLIYRLGSKNITRELLWDLLSITIDNQDVKDITIDGKPVQEVTVDGNTVWTGTNVNEVTTDVVLNGQSISLTVYEDTDGDGSAENTETVDVGDGTNTYGLSNLDGSGGNDYWIKWELGGSDITETAKANYADLKDVGVWGSGSEWDSSISESGVVHESVSNTDHNDTGVVKQGYSASNPLYSSSLAGYWPLQEDSGSTAYDFSGNNNDGTYYGPGLGNNGLLGASSPYFDGSNDYVDMGSGVTDFSNDWSLSIWAKWSVLPSSAGENKGVCMVDGVGALAYGRDNADTISTYIGGWQGSGFGISSGTWYHIVVTYDSSQGELKQYVNGSEQASHSVSISDSGGTLFFGDDNDQNKVLNGYLSDARIYSKVLSSSEVQALYNVVKSQGYLTADKKSS